MNTKRNKTIDPMLEGHPEPFSEPRTIPTGWDMSELLPQQPQIRQTTLNPMLLLTQDEDLPQDDAL